MQTHLRTVGALPLVLLLAGSIGVESRAAAQDRKTRQEPVRVARLPEGSRHPRAAVDGSGVAHVVYFQGDPDGGDLFHVTSDDGGESFSTPVRVNAGDGSVLGDSVPKSHRMAVSPEGRVHVVWLGSEKAADHGPGGETPVLYTRMEEEGVGFEPARNVIQTRYGVDASAAVAAGADGRVFVVWHAPGDEGPEELHRRVWLARSYDAGGSFAGEVAVNRVGHGVSAGCTVEAVVDSRGKLLILYRSCMEGMLREVKLLASYDQSYEAFETTRVDGWKRDLSPLSSGDLAVSARHAYVAWATKEAVLTARVIVRNDKLSIHQNPPGDPDRRRHPVVVANADRRILLLWIEGLGDERRVRWRLFEAMANVPSRLGGNLEDAPEQSRPAAFERPDGGFAIVY